MKRGGGVDAEEDALVILDSGTPGALDFARRVFDANVECRVIVIGLGEVESEVPLWASAGISGFVSRESHLADLMTTIREVAEGRWRSSADATAALLHHVALLARKRSPHEAAGMLTRREYEVLQLLGRAYSNKEIASELSIAVPTVKPPSPSSRSMA